VSAFFVQFATTRLVFISADVKGFLGGLYFVIYLVVIFSGLWKVVDHAIEMSVKGLAPEEDAHRLKYVLPMLHRVAHFVLIILGTNVLLARFGINLGSIATALGLGGLAISLAAQDVIGDLIAGFIILVSNKPFRMGDRIEIQGLDTWGDVVDISARTTSIRTRDNRMVIVPNSTIAKSQVVNYTYPDPRYRVQIEIGVAYGTDIEKTRRIIIETVSQIEDVLQDKPVDALYNAMGDSAMIFRVRWWIKSYADTRAIFDRVNTALQNALDEAGIEMPFPTQDINVQIDSDQRSEKET
jgi:small-conductance mechanosensitive channel